jgi:hypothetical protein
MTQKEAQALADKINAGALNSRGRPTQEDGFSLDLQCMDDACEDFIFSEDFVIRDADAVAAQAVKEVEEDFVTSPITNDVGQTVTFVESDKLHGWVTEHKNLRIIAITGYGGYVIVYETPKVEK